MSGDVVDLWRVTALIAFNTALLNTSASVVATTCLVILRGNGLILIFCRSVSTHILGVLSWWVLNLILISLGVCYSFF